MAPIRGTDIATMKVATIGSIIISIIVLGNMVEGTAAQTQIRCELVTQEVLASCLQFMKKEGPMIKPSQECCAVVKAGDLPCFCNVLERYPNLKALTSAKKIEFVAKQCGTLVSPGCESIIVPYKT